MNEDEQKGWNAALDELIGILRTKEDPWVLGLYDGLLQRQYETYQEVITIAESMRREQP